MDSKCVKCGREHRLVEIKGKTYCFECEKDVALKQIGIIRD